MHQGTLMADCHAPNTELKVVVDCALSNPVHHPFNPLKVASTKLGQSEADLLQRSKTQSPGSFMGEVVVKSIRKVNHSLFRQPKIVYIIIYV